MCEKGESVGESLREERESVCGRECGREWRRESVCGGEIERGESVEEIRKERETERVRL